MFLKYISVMYLLVILVVSTSPLWALAAVDHTVEPRTSGRNVVEATVDKISTSRIFKDDKQLLRRLAFVHTTDGNEDKTYRPGYFGGIWQVDEDQFLKDSS
ncbi:hypothetical protein HDE_11133 [Halotydeus destructor]|nr:hypothetical protein HDE_11133 [Halotydeus destructor]